MFTPQCVIRNPRCVIRNPQSAFRNPHVGSASFLMCLQPMSRLYRRWDRPGTFGDLVVVGFVLVQCLDGALTYLGVKTWGLEIEANPLISSVMSFAGLGAGLAGAKLFAVGLGMMLHLRRTHMLVALLTAFYLGAAILPWTALFLRN
jgi:hypothetical protein